MIWSSCGRRLESAYCQFVGSTKWCIVGQASINITNVMALCGLRTNSCSISTLNFTLPSLLVSTHASSATHGASTLRWLKANYEVWETLWFLLEWLLEHFTLESSSDSPLTLFLWKESPCWVGGRVVHSSLYQLIASLSTRIHNFTHQLDPRGSRDLSVSMP